jgi:hypothetical protein
MTGDEAKLVVAGSVPASCLEFRSSAGSSDESMGLTNSPSEPTSVGDRESPVGVLCQTDSSKYSH